LPITLLIDEPTEERRKYSTLWLPLSLLHRTSNMTTTYAPHPIAFKVKTEKPGNFMEFKFEHTVHSASRANQRGVTDLQISTALQYGDAVRKQGLIYYILGQNNIPASLQREKAKLKNIIVIVAGDSNQVITCYRTSNPFKYIRQKSKRLSKHS
jgi:hypothetical protein